MRRTIFDGVQESSSRRALLVRGGLPRTFGSLAGFLSLLLSCIGVYLIEDTLRHPVRAVDGALLVAGFVLGLAVTLLYFLLHPRRGTHRKRNRDRRQLEFLLDPAAMAAEPAVIRQNAHQARGIAGK